MAWLRSRDILGRLVEGVAEAVAQARHGLGLSPQPWIVQEPPEEAGGAAKKDAKGKGGKKAKTPKPASAKGVGVCEGVCGTPSVMGSRLGSLPVCSLHRVASGNFRDGCARPGPRGEERASSSCHGHGSCCGELRLVSTGASRQRARAAKPGSLGGTQGLEPRGLPAARDG